MDPRFLQLPPQHLHALVRQHGDEQMTLRLDQGVSYWRAAPSNSHQACHFNLNPGEVELRGKQLAELAAHIEGARLPTQLFLKVR